MQQNSKFYLWYNPRDKQYYEECLDCYDGFVIPANILAYNTNAFSVILEKTKKPYFIDPKTSTFQISDIDIFFNEKGLIRSSWEKVIKYYGSVIANSIRNKMHLTYSDFIDQYGLFKQSLEELTEKVVNFQRSIIRKKTLGLSRFFKTKTRENGLLFLTAPYFFFESLNDPWYNITIEMIIKSIKTKFNDKMYGVICTTKHFIEEQNNINKLIDDLNIEGLDGILIWIDTFDEYNESERYLSSLLYLINKLSSSSKQIINLYGGYFSNIAKYWGLNGFASGVNYKDMKEIYETQISGGPEGGPHPRYYIPLLHNKTLLDTALRFIRQFNEFKCNCLICQSNPEAYELSTPRNIRRFIMNKHFLQIKKQEIQEVGSLINYQLITKLDSLYRKYMTADIVLNVSYLNEWNMAIKNNMELINM